MLYYTDSRVCVWAVWVLRPYAPPLLLLAPQIAKKDLSRVRLQLDNMLKA